MWSSWIAGLMMYAVLAYVIALPRDHVSTARAVPIVLGWTALASLMWLFPPGFINDHRQGVDRAPCFGLQSNANRLAKVAVRERLGSPYRLSFYGDQVWQIDGCEFQFKGYVELYGESEDVIRKSYTGGIDMLDYPIDGTVTYLTFE